MAELREVFEMTTKQIEPDQDSWREQQRKRDRSSRNRRLGAFTGVAASPLWRRSVYRFAVRTTTPRAISDFFTVPLGSAFFTVTMTTSPSPAYLRRVPPSTRITSAVFAPELSATLTTDSC